jgi:hypothetical protein
VGYLGFGPTLGLLGAGLVKRTAAVGIRAGLALQGEVARFTEHRGLTEAHPAIRPLGNKSIDLWQTWHMSRDWPSGPVTGQSLVDPQP